MIKRRKTAGIAAALMLVISASCTVVYGLSDKQSSASVINRLNTDTVNIAVSEYTQDGTDEKPWVDKVNISPGSVISKIPRIKAEGVNCYVRAKLEITTDSSDEMAVTENNIGGISDQWIKAGDYYYYKNVLNTGDTVDFFDSVSIPEWWCNQQIYAETKFFLNVDVDAVQADNFTPQFMAANPWGDVEIFKSIDDNGYSLSRFETAKKSFMNIEVNDEGGIIMNPDDFFMGFDTFVAGDIMSDKAEIKNSGNHKVILYFQTETLEDKDLVSNMELKMYLTKEDETRCIYSGSLDCEEYREEKELAEFLEGEVGELSFQVSMPESLGNEYTLRNGAVKWSLRTEQLIKTPETGDVKYVSYMIAAGIIAGFALIWGLSGIGKKSR